MREIRLSQGKVAIVDDENYEWLNQWKWYAWKGRNTHYAVRTFWDKKEEKYKRIYMHRLILGLQLGDKQQVDHINLNGLDNRNVNMRICTPKENAANQNGRQKASKFKGVQKRKNTKKWIGRIRVSQKDIHLGYFNSEIEAAKAYDEAATKYFGKFGRLNCA